MDRTELLKASHEKMKAKKTAVTCPDGRMNTAAAAEFLGVTIASLAYLRANARGPEYIKPSGSIWYYKDDLIEWSKRPPVKKKGHENGGPKTNRTRHIALRVTDETGEAIDAAAHDTQRTISNWIETAILWALNEGAVLTRQVVPRPRGKK
jgi:hypothetical protein